MDTAILGWLSGILFAICGLPQAYKTIKTRKADDISLLFLFFCLGGEILGILFVWLSALEISVALPLLFNYVANLIATSLILRFKVFPSKKMVAK
jgi:uncharacterized protein with PQ loop repeat